MAVPGTNYYQLLSITIIHYKLLSLITNYYYINYILYMYASPCFGNDLLVVYTVTVAVSILLPCFTIYLLPTITTILLFYFTTTTVSITITITITTVTFFIYYYYYYY